MSKNDEGPPLWNRWIEEQEQLDRQAAKRNRPAPTTQSGEEWSRAERLVERLRETGDTPRSFVVKGAVGYAAVLGLALVAVWLVIRFVRALNGS